MAATRTLIKVAGLVVSAMAQPEPEDGGRGLQVLKTVVAGMRSGGTESSGVRKTESQKAQDAVLAIADEKDKAARELAKTDPVSAAQAEASNYQQRVALLAQANMMNHQNQMSMIRNIRA